MRRRSLDVIRVFRATGDRRRGRIVAGLAAFPCAFGSAGPVHRKREGDGGTPVAAMQVIGIHYRPDRMRRPRTTLPLAPISKRDGWCDDPGSPLYNRAVRLPLRASHERMWREDALYDLVLDLDWNRGPIRRGRGSAIFLHVARAGFLPTEGCIAVARNKIERLVAKVGRRTVIRVLG